MTDNIKVNPSTSATGVDTATNDIGGVHHPKFLIEYGEPGTANQVSDISRLPVADFFHSVAEGRVSGHSLIQKFGASDEITASYTPLAHGAIYPTPQAGSPVKLRVKAGGNTNDNQAGSGARSIHVEGLTVDGSVVAEILLTHATDGTLVGVTGIVDFIRVFRVHVEESGTYATVTAGSHGGLVTIESTGGVEYARLNAVDLPRGQSQIGCYTVPLGFTAYVYSFFLTTDGNKAMDFIFFQRESILQTAAPYEPMRTVIEGVGVVGEHHGAFKGGRKFNALTDIGWLVKSAAATPYATVDFEILLVADT